MNDVMVTAYCLAYNHEKYIKKTLEGFVSQKTKFKYNVIIHDDASNDNTRDIIMFYKNKYPNLFITIFQNTNQYSKNVDIFKKFIIPSVKGKYIATCDGDDYWLDENKLQMQVDYMEKNPGCSLCGHNTLIINENGTFTNKTIYDLDIEKDFNTREVILADGGGIFHTSSFLFRRSDIIDMTDDYSISGIGDYTTKIYLSLKGYLHYFPSISSAYRINSLGSWTQRTFNSRVSLNNHISNMVGGLKKMNEATKNLYNYEFEYMILKYMITKYIHDGEFFKLFLNKDSLKMWIQNFSLSGKIKCVIKMFYYKFVKFMEERKND